MEMTAQKKPMLMEVVFIRLVLILFLVAYHSFAPYCGAWENFSGQTEIPLFHNFGVVLCSFFLQAFVFISGYIFGYQAGRNPGKLKFGECVAKKAKRLLIPSVVFSALYYAMFYDLTASPAKIGYTILNGAGHMWFLPMLFWCFVGVWIVERININKWIVISLSVLAALLWVSLPLRTGEAAGYFFYFYLGYALKKGTINLSIRHGNIIALVAAFSWAICCAAKIIISQNAGLVDLSRGGAARRLACPYVHYGHLGYCLCNGGWS